MADSGLIGSRIGLGGGAFEADGGGSRRLFRQPGINFVGQAS
jgi:hypothetical protein